MSSVGMFITMTILGVIYAMVVIEWVMGCGDGGICIFIGG